MGINSPILSAKTKSVHPVTLTWKAMQNKQVETSVVGSVALHLSQLVLVRRPVVSSIMLCRTARFAPSSGAKINRPHARRMLPLRLQAVFQTRERANSANLD